MSYFNKMKKSQPSQTKGSFSGYLLNQNNYTAKRFKSRISKLKELESLSTSFSRPVSPLAVKENIELN